MELQEKIENLRAIADGRLTADDKAFVLELCKVYGIKLRGYKCKSCYRDAALQLYYALTNEKELSKSTGVVRLIKPLNFNGEEYDADTPSDVVHKLLRRGLPHYFVKNESNEQNVVA